MPLSEFRRSSNMTIHTRPRSSDKMLLKFVLNVNLGTPLACRRAVRQPQARHPVGPLHAVANARFCFASRVHGFVPVPFDRARSTSQTVRSPRAGIRSVPQGWRASVCGSAAGVALRLHCAMCSVSPLADTETEAKFTTQGEHAPRCY